MKHRAALLSLAILTLCPAFTAHAQDASATTESSGTSLTYAQQQAIQQDITNGITNGTLSQAQIEALQQQLSSGKAGSTGNTGQPYGTAGIPRGEGIQPLGSTPTTGNAPITRRTTTGPDPFTYNSLGPDAYQAQKYQNPGYNVPAYPTTDPQTLGTTQQYSGPSAGTPYGAGYGQAPSAGANTSQGVYVYRPPSTR